MINQSRLAAYQRCPKYYDYKYVQGLELITDNTIKRDFGSAFHRAQEVILLGYDLRTAILVTLDEFPDIFENAPNTHNKNALLRAIVWWHDLNLKDPLKIVHDANGEPVIERYFEFAHQYVYDYFGTADRVVSFAGENWVADSKTTGAYLTDNFLDKFELRLQSMLYVVAMKQHLDIPIAGFLIDAAHTLVNSTNFARRTYPYTDDQLREALLTAGKIVNNIRTANFWRNTEACFSLGKCVYHDLCAAKSAPDFAAAKERYYINQENLS